MKLGIGSYTYPWAMGVLGRPAPSSPLSLEGLIGRAGELGVGVVQICDNCPLQDAAPGDLLRLAEQARGAGITLEAGTRGTEPALLSKYLEVAGALGTRLVRSMIAGDITRAEGEIREVLPAYERAGVVLALENYERHPVRELAALISRAASPFLGACLDTVNSLGALEPPDQVISALLPHTANLHVKDFDVVRADHRMGFSVVGTPAGKGRLDIPALLRAVRENGRDPNAILELWTPFAGTVDQTVEREDAWARESISHLRRYIES